MVETYGIGQDQVDIQVATRTSFTVFKACFKYFELAIYQCIMVTTLTLTVPQGECMCVHVGDSRHHGKTDLSATNNSKIRICLSNPLPADLSILIHVVWHATLSLDIKSQSMESLYIQVVVHSIIVTVLTESHYQHH
jgi:hypothetical protein